MPIWGCYGVGVKTTDSTTENTVPPLLVVSEVCGFKATGTTYRKGWSFVFLSETPPIVGSQKTGGLQEESLWEKMLLLLLYVFPISSYIHRHISDSALAAKAPGCVTEMQHISIYFILFFKKAYDFKTGLTKGKILVSSSFIVEWDQVGFCPGRPHRASENCDLQS